jgi:hypothetical protein
MPFQDLAVRVAEVRERIALAVARGGHRQEVTIVAVTKTHGADAVRAAIGAGLPDIGENRVQEATAKMDALASDTTVAAVARWHLIGHMQRNKVKAVERFALIHSLDSERLAAALHEQGERQGRAVETLVQVNVSGEATKGGFPLSDLEAAAERLRALPGLCVRGVMTMAPYEAPEPELRAVFSGARRARSVLAAAGLPASVLSMGMSGDYEIAVEEGATHVRLGTLLFGARPT